MEFFHENRCRVRESIKPYHKQCDKNPEILNICICIFHLCFSFVFFVCVLHLCLPFFHIDMFDCVSELYRFAFAPFICVLTHGLHLHLCLCCQRTLQKCRDQCMNACCLFWCVWITQTLSQTTRNFKYLHLCFSFVFFICALHLRLPFFFSHLHFWFCAYIKSFCICVFYLCFDTWVAFTFVFVLSTHAPKMPGPVKRTNVVYFVQQRC